MRIFAFLLAFLAVTAAFEVGPLGTFSSSSRGIARTASRLSAWSLSTSPFGSSGSSWYQECNPTARRTVYDDAPFDYAYSFVPLGDDWPSLSEPSLTVYPREQDDREQSPRNPLRRAARWARRLRRRN